MRYASIDIGTNTIRLLIAETDGRILNTLLRKNIITRLGDNLVSNAGLLDASAIDRTIGAVSSYTQLARDFNVPEKNVFAVATSAARKAGNGELLRSGIRSATGIDLQIISGKDEALLTSKGIMFRFKEILSDLVITDIGGGSTEIILISGGETVDMASLDLGVLYLIQNSTDDTDQLIEDSLRDHFAKMSGNFHTGIKPRLVATSATPITIASICRNTAGYDPDAVEGIDVSKNEIKKLLVELSVLTPQERLLTHRALQPGREETIVPGIKIMLSIMDHAGSDSMTVTQYGLLEGFIIDNISRY